MIVMTMLVIMAGTDIVLLWWQAQFKGFLMLDYFTVYPWGGYYYLKLMNVETGSERLSDSPKVCCCCCCCCCLIAQSCPTLCDPIDCSPPGSSVHRVILQEHWSELLFLSPGDLSNPGIRPASPALAGRFFTTESPGKPTQLQSKTGWLWSTSSQSFYLMWEGKPGWEADAGPPLAGSPLLISFPPSVTF